MDYNSLHAALRRRRSHASATGSPGLSGAGRGGAGRGTRAGLTEGAAAAEDGGGSVRLLAPRLLRAHLPLSVLRILA